MLGLDLSETEVVRVADTDWTIGLLPLVKFEELTDTIDDARQPFREHVKAHTETDADARSAAINACETCTALWNASERKLRPAYREVVRWGLRPDAGAAATSGEPVQLAGREYRVAPMPLIEQMARVRGGSLVAALANAILGANRLSEREVLGFK